jgi:hypothetical protein
MAGRVEPEWHDSTVAVEVVWRDMVSHLYASGNGYWCLQFEFMQGKIRKRWVKICDQAATEEDPQKLLEIYKEILGMLDENAARLYRRWAREQVESKPN